jgi:nucleotide-binding universal stress UspA family protein
MTAPILAGFCPRGGDAAPVEFAAAASRATGAPLVVVAVHSGGSVLDRLTGGEFGHHSGGDDRAAVAALTTDLRERAPAATVREVEHTTPARGLAQAVAELHPQLLVLGSAHHGKHGHVHPGSTAERLISGSECPVAVVPRGHAAATHRHRTVGAAFVPTPEGREALRAAAELARAFAARLRVVMVLDPKHAEEQSPGLMAGQHHDADPEEAIAGRHRIEARQELDRAIAELASGVDAEPDVLYQDAAEGLEAASQVLDLLVMGSRGYGPVRSVLLGGVSRRVVAGAACPVLVLPRGAEAAVEPPLASADAEAPA